MDLDLVMASNLRRCLFVTLIVLQNILCFYNVLAADCTGVSMEVKCECDDFGHCLRGTVEVDPWVQATLRTQMDVQLDLPFIHAQFLDAHNAYNNRAYGPLYGANDNCLWPPPYGSDRCLSVANQEFSFTDMLNFGIRGLELDNWYCYDEMRVAHLGTDEPVMCNEQHVTFSAAVEEIGSWLDNHEGEFLRIYINEKFDQGHDESINGPLERYFGDRVLTPADLRDTYGGQWPTLRTMRKAGKSVVIGHLSTAGAGESYVHQGKFIHEGFWKDNQRKYFTNYPQCGGKNATNVLRFYSDSTRYFVDFEPVDGPSRVGWIDDFSEFVKCGIQYPAGDQVTPQLTATAVYTWAAGEPSKPLTDTTSCILLRAQDSRWYTPSDCSQDAYYACQNVADVTDWSLSESAGGYDVDSSACPTGYRFALPQNGFQHQKLLEVLDGTSVWLNVAPLVVADYEPPTAPPRELTTSDNHSTRHTVSEAMVFAAAATVALLRAVH